MFDSGHVLSEKMGRNCFRSISITGGADRVCMAITYISLLLAIESTGFNVQPLGNDSRSILYSTSGFFNEDNYTNRTEGKFACCRGHRDTVEGASKRIKHLIRLIRQNLTRRKIKHLSFPSFVEGYLSNARFYNVSTILVQSEGEEDIDVSKTVALRSRFKEFIFFSLMVAGSALYDTTRPKRVSATNPNVMFPRWILAKRPIVRPRFPATIGNRTKNTSH